MTFFLLILCVARALLPVLAVPAIPNPVAQVESTEGQEYQHGEIDETCGFLVTDKFASVECGERLQTSCLDTRSLARFCPADCPYVDRSQFFPCLARCTTADSCHSGLRAIEFPNSETMTCDPCAVIGCLECSRSSAKRCLKCNEPVFKLDAEGNCVYTLEEGVVSYLVTLIEIGALLVIPFILLKMCRPQGRPEVISAAERHIEQCKVNVMTTVEMPDGSAKV